MGKLILKDFEFNNHGCTIDYKYELSTDIKKYFDKKNPFYITYQYDVSTLPKSLAVIPFLANIMPIAWFAGFDVLVDEVDEDFYNSINIIKNIFHQNYPNNSFKGGLIAKKIIKNTINGSKKAMLFSGGVDAFATYIRLYEHTPDLITIHGPDIEIADEKQWLDLKNYIDHEPILKNNKKNYIVTNVRDFYTYHVSLLLEDLSWWGKVQHGVSLLGVVAPLSYINKYSEISIASSYTKDIIIAWGSTPETDEALTWAGIKIKHDGYELKRQDKVDLIAEFIQTKNKTLRLRVCYSELREEFNCSKCEKCYRTIIGLVLAGQNPNNFGFNVDENFYQKMFDVLSHANISKGMNYFWWEISEKAKVSTIPFIFKDAISEKKQIKKIAERKVDQNILNLQQKSETKKNRIKFILRNKFSKLYNLYRSIR